jgi:hypothetical protein
MGSPFADEAYKEGDVRHAECDCCEHAAKRIITLRQSIEHAIRMIEGGFAGEMMYELDRVLSCLNEWCNNPPENGAPRGNYDKTTEDEIAF